ncbi:13956_t:CDS:2, partial [Acaulospora morrowiae]
NVSFDYSIDVSLPLAELRDDEKSSVTQLCEPGSRNDQQNSCEKENKNSETSASSIPLSNTSDSEDMINEDNKSLPVKEVSISTGTISKDKQETVNDDNNISEKAESLLEEEFLDFRFQKGVLEDKKTEYSQYKSDLDTIKGLSCISSVTNYPVNCGWQWEKTAVSCTPSSTTLPIAVGSGKRSRSVDEHALDKKSQSLISFWDLQTKRQTIHMNSKILEEEAQLQQNELKNQIHIERTKQILDATKGIRNQDYLLREITTKQIEKDLLNELYAKNENLEEEAPSIPPDKVKI